MDLLGLRQYLLDLTDGNNKWIQWLADIIFLNKSLSASWIVACIVYILVQKPYLNARLRNAFGWQKNTPSTDGIS